MSFLAPWFIVAGIAAVGLPIVFHLFRRTPRGRVPFSSLMFLTPSPPRLTSRSRLDHWPLLLLRALVLVLLALAFGRPLWRQLVETGADQAAGKRTLLLVDTSASMRRADLWPQAQAALRKFVAASAPQDELAIVAFDTSTRTPVTFDVWRQTPHTERAGLAEAALAELAPSWNGTHFDQALAAAADALETAAHAKREAAGEARPAEIVLITDLQTGGRTQSLQAYEWPERAGLRVVPLTTATVNAGVQALEMSPDAVAADAADVRPRVLVTNAANSSREQFELVWQEPGSKPQDPSKAGAGAKSTPTYVPPGQTRVVRTPAPPAGDVLRLELRGDDEPFDNTLWFVPPRKERLRVLHLSDENPDDPQTLRYFLERAFASSGARRVVAVETVDPHAAGVRVPGLSELDDVALVVVAVEKALPPDWIKSLATWIERGGQAAAVIQSPASAAWRDVLPADVGGAEKIKVAEPKQANEYALLSQIDFRHPLFAPLADPRYSDFTKIRFWKHRTLTLDDGLKDRVQVLARFDSGEPAIVDVPRGAGRVVLFAAGWQPRESQLGVSSKFVPIVSTLVDLGSRGEATTATFAAGETIDLAALGRSETQESRKGEATAEPRPNATQPNATRARAVGPWTIRDPAGKETAVAADRPTYTFAAGPGVYEIRSADALRRVAVNLAADESKTAPLGVETLESLGVRLAKDDAAPTPAMIAERRTLQLEELESKQQLWRAGLLAAIVLLIAETWYAGRVARRESVA